MVIVGSVGLAFFVRITGSAALAAAVALAGPPKRHPSRLGTPVQMHCLQDTGIYQCHAYNRHNYNNAANLLHNCSLPRGLAFRSVAVLALPKE
jgi:hypothetical protein